MTDTLKTVGIIGVFLSLICLAACGSSPPTSAPTLDLNPLRTEVASTVLAQVTQTLLVAPSDTVVPSPTPTVTPLSTSTPSASPSPGTTGTPSSETPEAGLEDRAQWVSQSITDGTTFTPGETFTITWRLKNVGASTWTAVYLLRFYSGDAFGAPNEVSLGREVKPDEMIDLTLRMKAPTRPGDYRSDWVLSNEKRSNFKEPVFLKIVVAAPSTSTPTPTRTPTPSATP